MSSSTNEQYKRISGNFSKYFSRLANHKNRKDDGLTKEVLLGILEKQDGKCALSGVELTCQLKKGEYFPANASIDRIEAGGSYEPSNIQLVAHTLNKFRGNATPEQLVEMCKKVVETFEKD